jgi:hypothetical protein
MIVAPETERAGTGFTVMLSVCAADAQPEKLLPVTEYTVLVDGETTMFASWFPSDQV